MNSNKEPSLNMNYLRKNKNNNYISIISNIFNINNKILTLQNNINFDYFLNSNNNKYKKKFILKLNTFKKEKTYYYDSKDIEEINENHNSMRISYNNINNKYQNITLNNFYKKNYNDISELNSSNESKSNQIKYIEKTLNKKKIDHISLDSSIKIKNDNYENKNINKDFKLNIYNINKNEKNYKNLLIDVQKRMSFLVNNLINNLIFISNLIL